MPDPIAQAAEEVLHALGMWRLPVDPFAIAREEKILLAPGAYGDGFDARIEYFPSHRRFGIFYRETNRSSGRIKFSLGHELGHFYLPEHREQLLRGIAHDSESDYRSTDDHEQQADRFAANLLMPKELFVREVRQFRQSVCDLKDLILLADRLQTSVTSTAIRYCDCDIEPAMVLFSVNGIVQWSWFSDDMKSLGCWYVKNGSRIPHDSQTAKLLQRLDEGPFDEIVGDRIEPDVWFQWPKCKWLYEESVKMGGRVLTWLVLDG